MIRLVLGGLAVFVVVFGALYSGDIVSEHTVAVVVSASLLFGPILFGCLAQIGLARGSRSVSVRQRGFIVLSSVFVAALAGYQTFSALYPAAPRYVGVLSESQTRANLGQPPARWFELTVAGTLPEREGAATVDYEIGIDSGSTSSVKGSLWRSFDQVRVGRRGQAMAEHHRTYERHTVKLSAEPTTLSLARLSGDLPTGLRFELRDRFVPPWLEYVLFIAALLAAAFVDARLSPERTRSVFTSTLAFSALFSILYRDQLSNEAWLRPIFGSALVAGFGAVFIAGVLTWLLRRVANR